MPNIAELTRELREEIVKQYGVEAHIKISIHEHWRGNEHLCRQTVLQLGMAMARQYGKDTEVKIKGHDGTGWVNVEPAFSENTSITLFHK